MEAVTAKRRALGSLGNELPSRHGVLPKLRLRRSQDFPQTSTISYSAVMLKPRGLGLYAIGNVYNITSLPIICTRS
jgi:hypothetical protein